MKLAMLQRVTGGGRETIGTLRASHEAMRLAWAVLANRRLDVERICCDACGTGVDGIVGAGRDCLFCPCCGARINVPGNLRSLRFYHGKSPEPYAGDEKGRVECSGFGAIALGLMVFQLLGFVVFLIAILAHWVAGRV